MIVAFCPSCGQSRQHLGAAAACPQCGRVPEQVAAQFAPTVALPTWQAPPAFGANVGFPARHHWATPARGRFITAGVLCIVTSAFMLMGAAGMALMADRPEVANLESSVDVASVLRATMIVMGALGIVGVIVGAFACAGKPSWTLTAAIWQTLLALFMLLSIAGNGGGGAVVGLLLTTVGAVFGYLGYGQAKAYQDYKRMSNVHEVF